MKKSTIFRLFVIIAAVSMFTVTQGSAFEILTAEDVFESGQCLVGLF